MHGAAHNSFPLTLGPVKMPPVPLSGAREDRARAQHAQHLEIKVANMNKERKY